MMTKTAQRRVDVKTRKNMKASLPPPPTFKPLPPGSIEAAAYNIIKRDFALQRIPVHEMAARQAAVNLAGLVSTILRRQA